MYQVTNSLGQRLSQQRLIRHASPATPVSATLDILLFQQREEFLRRPEF